MAKIVQAKSSLGRSKEKLARLKKALRRYEQLECLGKTGKYISLGLLGLTLTGEAKRIPAGLLSAAVVQLLSAPAEKFGLHRKKELLAYCVGKPRVTWEIARKIRNPAVFDTLRIIGEGKFNLTEKEAIIAVLSGKASELDNNYANKAVKREVERLGIGKNNLIQDLK